MESHIVGSAYAGIDVTNEDPLLVQGGGLAKIAWAFLRPIGAEGECNVGVRTDNQSLSPYSSVDRMG